jgi:uroporphyrinogen decarboxylase
MLPMSDRLLELPVQPDWEGLMRCIARTGTPDRVHYIELFLDPEVNDAVAARFGIDTPMSDDPTDRYMRRYVAIQRFLGYDFVRCGVEDMAWPLNREATDDTASLARSGGRSYIDEHRGPITSWDDFERYPWPDPARAGTRALEWCEKHLPDDMCVIAGGGFGHIAEHVIWLMGYESICYALYDQRDLVRAISDRVVGIFEAVMRIVLQFPRVKATWGSDDLGHRSGTLISPPDTREFLLPGHKVLAAMSHAAGRPYLLHSCGNLAAIMDDLINDVGIDAKHSFEDTIESVIDAKETYGRRIALLGGIDVDFLCTADEQMIRKRVRKTLDRCMPGGGYCLGTGNSVANYIPLESYLVMLDEGRRWRG